jgi:hypothetical protein
MGASITVLLTTFTTGDTISSCRCSSRPCVDLRLRGDDVSGWVEPPSGAMAASLKGN